MNNYNNIEKFKIPSKQETTDQVIAKIQKIDAILESLYNTALVSVGNGDVAEYEIDTGQTKTKVKYTSTTSVTNAIERYEKIRDMLRAKLSPRVVRLMDAKNWIR